MFDRSISSREKEVLSKIVGGLTAKEIASELYISEHTVESHRRNLVQKFQARNTLHMAVKAIRMGVVYALMLMTSVLYSQVAPSNLVHKLSNLTKNSVYYVVADEGFITTERNNLSGINRSESRQIILPPTFISYHGSKSGVTLLPGYEFFPHARLDLFANVPYA